MQCTEIERVNETQYDERMGQVFLFWKGRRLMGEYIYLSLAGMDSLDNTHKKQLCTIKGWALFFSHIYSIASFL